MAVGVVGWPRPSDPFWGSTFLLQTLQTLRRWEGVVLRKEQSKGLGPGKGSVFGQGAWQRVGTPGRWEAGCGGFGGLVWGMIRVQWLRGIKLSGRGRWVWLGLTGAWGCLPSKLLLGLLEGSDPSAQWGSCRRLCLIPSEAPHGPLPGPTSWGGG